MQLDQVKMIHSFQVSFIKRIRLTTFSLKNKKIKRKYEKLLGAKVFNTGSFLSNYFPIKKIKKNTICYLFLLLKKEVK